MCAIMRKEVSYDEEKYKRSASPLARSYRLLGDEAFPGQGKSRDEELTKLKRELAKVKQERDFLRDAAVFFAKESK